MFDFTLTEEEELIAKTAADFAKGQLFPPFRDYEAAGAIPDALVKAYRELGFAELELPEAQGGAGLSPFNKALVLEGLAGGDAAAAVALDGLGPALYPLLEMGGGEGAKLAKEYLAKDGLRGWVVVDAEGRLEVSGGKVKGTWPWIPAEKLDLLVVLKDGKAHLITEGMKHEHVKPCALTAAGSSSLELGGPIAQTFDAGAKAYVRTLGRLRLYASALLIGISAASLRHTIAYTQERIVFGKPIAHHQGAAFLIADLAARIDGARLSVWRAAWALAQEGDPTEAAAGAYLDAIDIALEMGEQGVQLLGGHGYMQDHPVEKWMREARTISLLFGGRDGALDDAVARVFDAPAQVGFALPKWAGNGA